jgi:ADP-ribosylglycohydrolase
MILHALGDTIGFKNGEWEFNYFREDDSYRYVDFINEFIYHFIALGGVNGINLKGWNVSDDTILHISTGKSLLKYNKNISESLITIFKKNILNSCLSMDKDYKNGVNRYEGTTIVKSVNRFDKHDARFDDYNKKGGGNGAAMRTLIIGYCFSGETNRDTLIDLSIITSQLTHNNAIGYLGGFNAALFTAFAIEKVPIDQWGYMLIDYLNSDKLKSYLSLDNIEQIYDHHQYIKHWQRYLDTKFDNNRKHIDAKSNINPMARFNYYWNNFYLNSSENEVGGSAFLCMIMAYDALLDCDGKWEKLIVYAMLHSGDSDTTGAIAGGLYGAVYGLGDVPLHMLTHIEHKNEIIKLSKKLAKKFIN